MGEDSATRGSELLSIQLMGAKTGIPAESLIPALQRVFPRKTEAQIREALKRLPILLTRGVNREQALKVKRFLEANGAVIKITPSKAPGPATARARVKAPPPPPPGEIKREMKGVSAGPGEERLPPGAERRKKPRVHPGFDIRPMGVGDILDRSFKLLYKYFWLFFVIVLIPQGLFFLIQKAAQISFLPGAKPAQPPGPALAAGIALFVFLMLILWQFLWLWTEGPLIYAVSETYLGHRTSIKESFRAVKRVFWKILWTNFLWGIFVSCPFIIGMVFVSILIPLLVSTGVSNWFTGLVVFVVIVVFIWLFFRMILNWLLRFQVVVLEAKSGMSALRRSKELMTAHTEKGFWKRPKIKGILILLIGFFLAAGIQLVFQIPMTIATFAAPGSMIVRTIHEILNTAASSLAVIFFAIAMIIFYYDIRLRREGFDLKMMAENL